MDWNRDVLEHIVALLFSLAGLADIAAGLPASRRRHVLGILSHGEVEACAFVTEMILGDTACADCPVETVDASRMAASFRALALILFIILMRWRAFCAAIAPPVVRRGPAGLPGRAWLSLLDTS